MLSGMLSSSSIGTSRGNRGFTACAVKNNLRSDIHTDRKAQNLNCYFHLVDATLENKCMWRALQRCIKRNRPRKWVNLKQQGWSNRKREYATRHSWIFQMKRGKQNLERVYYHLRLCVLWFFHRRLNLTIMQKFPMVAVIVIGLAIFLTSADPCDHSGCHKMVTTCTGQVVLISGEVGHQPYLFFGQVNPREITLF